MHLPKQSKPVERSYVKPPQPERATGIAPQAADYTCVCRWSNKYNKYTMQCLIGTNYVDTSVPCIP